MSFSVPSAPPPAVPNAPAAPPMFGSSTQGQKPQAKASQPTWLGAAGTTNPGNATNKTLLGS